MDEAPPARPTNLMRKKSLLRNLAALGLAVCLTIGLSSSAAETEPFGKCHVSGSRTAGFLTAECEYPIPVRGDKSRGRRDPQQIAAFAIQNFKTIFPLPTAKMCTINPGSECPLYTWKWPNWVRVEGVGPYGFGFLALPWHLEGRGRLIRFTVRVDSDGNPILRVCASGPWTVQAEATYRTPGGSWLWAGFARNIGNAFSDVPG